MDTVSANHILLTRRTDGHSISQSDSNDQKDLCLVHTENFIRIKPKFMRIKLELRSHEKFDAYYFASN
jgi:hypothetical protein